MSHKPPGGLGTSFYEHIKSQSLQMFPEKRELLEKSDREILQYRFRDQAAIDKFRQEISFRLGSTVSLPKGCSSIEELVRGTYEQHKELHPVPEGYQEFQPLKLDEWRKIEERAKESLQRQIEAEGKRTL